MDEQTHVGSASEDVPADVQQLNKRIESEILIVRRLLTTFEDVIGSLKDVNKSFAVNIDQGIALASNLSKYGSDINMEPAMAETFKKLGKVHYYVEGKKNKMNVTLQLFRIALEQLQGELGDLKALYEKEYRALDQKYQLAEQKVLKIRQSKGGVNMQKLVEAEDERAAVREQMLLVGNGLVEKLNGVNGKAKLCLSEGLQQTLLAYNSFFTEGSKQFAAWLGDPVFMSTQESGQPVPGDDNWKRLGSEESPVYIRRPSQRKSNNDDTLSFTSASPPPPNNAAPSIPTDPRHIHEQQIDDQSGQQRLSGWLPARQRPSRLQKLTFEVEKKSARRQKNKQSVLSLDFEEKSIKRYLPHKQKTLVHLASELYQVARCGDDRQLKLIWKGIKAEKFVFLSREQKERFYEASWAMRHPSSGGKKDEHVEKLSLFISSWNLGNAAPPKSLAPWIPLKAYDIYVIAAQECDYPSRPEYPNCESDWFALIQTHLGEEYITIASRSLTEMRMIVLAKRAHYYKISEVKVGTEATGIGNVYGNKGGIGISFRVNNTKVCFVGSHLAARDERVNARNANYTAIVNGLRLTNNEFDIANNYHVIFWLGDLNYRINLPRDKVLEEINGKNWLKLLQNDQLLLERKNGRAFSGFHEQPINFQPTYRYNRGDRTYSEEKMRVPSYCDRILYKNLPCFVVEAGEYACCNDVTTSDHSPVYGIFSLTTHPPNCLADELRAQAAALALGPTAFTGVSAAAAVATGEECATVGKTVDMKGGALLRLTDLKLQLGTSLGSGWGGSGESSITRGSFRTKKEKVARNINLTFMADYLEGACATATHDDVQPGQVATWKEHLLPSFTANIDWLARQHLWVLVKDRAKVIAQGCIPLALACGKEAAQFSAKLTIGGLLIGVLTGSLHVVPSPVRKESPELDLGYQQDVVKQGCLIKEGKTRKSWKRRWFVLTGGAVFYYVNQTAAKAKGSIELQGSKVEEYNHPNKKNCFSIVNKKRTFLMCADDEAELKAWLTAIQRCINGQPSTSNGSEIIAASPPTLGRGSGIFLASAFLAGSHPTESEPATRQPLAKGGWS